MDTKPDSLAGTELGKPKIAAKICPVGEDINPLINSCGALELSVVFQKVC